MNNIPDESLESSESEEEYESGEDEEQQVLRNVTSMEQILATHTRACKDQRFTRLPCAAHKVMSKTFSE